MSTRNIFWGVKGSWCVGLTTYHLHVPIVLKYGSLNLLEPSGPVQTCNEIALLFPSQRWIKLCEIWGSHDCHYWAACSLL